MIRWRYSSVAIHTKRIFFGFYSYKKDILRLLFIQKGYSSVAIHTKRIFFGCYSYKKDILRLLFIQKGRRRRSTDRNLPSLG